MQIAEIFKYVKKLSFIEDPDYNKISYFFLDFLYMINYKKNETFSWIKDKKILSLKNNGFILRKKSSSKKKNYDRLTHNENIIKSHTNNKQKRLLIDTSYSPNIPSKYKSQLHFNIPSNEVNYIYNSINPSIIDNKNNLVKNNYLSEIKIYRYRKNKVNNIFKDYIQNDRYKNLTIKGENYHPKTDIKNLTNSFYSKTNYSLNSSKDNYIKRYVPKFVKENFIKLTGSNKVSKSINLKHIQNNKLMNHYNQIKKRSNNYNSYNPYQEININNTNSFFKSISYMDN
jgi:hypothetical protein